MAAETKQNAKVITSDRFAKEDKGVIEYPNRKSSSVSQGKADLNKFKPGRFAEDVRNLSKIQKTRWVVAFLFDWVVIIGSFATALMFSHPAVWIVAAVIIATRQHALLILMHEGSHYRFMDNRKWNDRLSNWFMAYPMFVTVEGYRRHQLAHHNHLNTDEDPDWMRKKDKKEWEFPKTKSGIMMVLLRDFFGGGLYDNIVLLVMLKKARKSKNKAVSEKQTGRAKAIMGIIGYYAVVAGIITITDMWVPMLLLWYLPMFTALAVLLRIRSVAEHFGLPGKHDLNMSRNLHGSFLECFLFAPHNIGYHLDHHLFPSVPFYNLSKLNRALMQDSVYAGQSHQTIGVVVGKKSLLSDLTGR